MRSIRVCLRGAQSSWLVSKNLRAGVIKMAGFPDSARFREREKPGNPQISEGVA